MLYYNYLTNILSPSAIKTYTIMMKVAFPKKAFLSLTVFFCFFNLIIPTHGTEKPQKPTNQYTETIKGVSFTMKFVEGGSFMMGCDGSDCLNNTPRRAVTVGSYYIAETEVTQELFIAIMGRNTSRYNDCTQCPVEQVSWKDAREFIEKLNSLSKRQYRLPSEAEWEFAARGGVKSRNTKFSGSNIADEVAWHSDNSNFRTHPVRTKKPNELGLYDMSGNVGEICEDDWHNGYSNKAPTDGSAWIDSPRNEFERVERGGANRGKSPSHSSVSSRILSYSIYPSSTTGFRIVANEGNK